MNIYPIVLGTIVANCYLIEDENNFMLVDTGRTSKKKELLAAIESHGCHPCDLKVVIMTHGHFDHTGLGAYFQDDLGIPVIMHKEAALKVITGDMFYGDNKIPKWRKWLVNKLFAIKTFTPTIQIEDDLDLTTYGFDGIITPTPGHSTGSLSLIFKDGHLISGDLFENVHAPKINTIMDDIDLAKKSYEKLSTYTIQKVYPGHGEPFDFSKLNDL